VEFSIPTAPDNEKAVGLCLPTALIVHPEDQESAHAKQIGIMIIPKIAIISA
jgi:hypothetical protein